MKTSYSETAESDPNCEIRYGVASWDNGTNTAYSVKFTWFNAKDGKASRGGEVPIEALPQMLEIAVKHGALKLAAR